MLTNDKPPPKNVQELGGAGYRLCGAYNRTPRPEERVVLNCVAPKSGRYLYVYLPRRGALEFCEVEVFKSGNYSAVGIVSSDNLIVWSFKISGISQQGE